MRGYNFTNPQTTFKDANGNVKATFYAGQTITLTLAQIINFAGTKAVLFSFAYLALCMILYVGILNMLVFET